LEIGIDEILAGNSLRSVDNLKGISHNQNSISIKLNNYSYRSAANSKYYFTITGPNGTGQSDSSLSPTLKFSLDPGEYEVLVYAEDKLLNVRSNSFTIPISIKNPFYREWWFLLSTVALFALLFTSITLIVIRRVKNRELQKRNLVLRIADLEARALQGQMNPHFIFNAVNSVQDFILNSRTEEAHLFLSSFAKLIRMVLEHSRKKNVSLEEEISLIRLYVSIEEQRLRESVSLEVDMPDSIDAENILLPSMLLQPLVENAIWHGLNKQTGKKTITLKFREEGKVFIIEISDNGIGLQSSDQIHTSVGLEIVKERIRLTYEEAPAFDFFSIQNKPGNEGVVVRIVLPLQTEY
jgi:sensor histidine kinase YesM